LGGSGTVGREVLRALSRAGASCTFTFHQGESTAKELSRELGCEAIALDLRDPSALPALASTLEGEGAVPSVVVHCAAVLRGAPLGECSDSDWDDSMAVNARSAFALCREFGRRIAAQGGGDIVLVGALDRTQSLPVPTAFAATQGLLGSLCMAAAKELGPQGVRVNMVALGLLDAGLSLGLAPKLRDDFRAYSALRRFGTAPEAARTIAWFALNNTYVNGKVLSANGGI
jgi:NAD(P)-dependent dehydrogenase (short-subunit alcohol dehydrogenase family)